MKQKLLALLFAVSTSASAFTVDTSNVLGPMTGMWWNSAQSGWGTSITQQYSTIFVATYHFALSGAPDWFVFTCAPIVGDSCSGDIYTVKNGAPVTHPWTPATATLAGTGSLQFTSINTAHLKVTLNGFSVDKPITRMLWGAPPGKNHPILALINQLRATGDPCNSGGFYQPVPPLTWDDSLELAATRHSQDMADNNYFSHTGLNNSTFWERANAAGFTGWPVGENLAAGAGTEEQAFAMWHASGPHCANMMNGSANTFGVGSGSNYSSDYGMYWTMILGTK